MDAFNCKISRNQKSTQDNTAKEGRNVHGEK